VGKEGGQDKHLDAPPTARNRKMNSNIYISGAGPDDDQSFGAAPKNKFQKSHPKRYFPKSACLYTDMNQNKSITVDQHYTVAEVAELLNVHEMTVRHWYWRRGLRIQRVGRKGVRIAAADLKAFLDQFNRAA
jgi:excisionase family DNA binding protein